MKNLKIICPDCKKEIDSLKYSSNVFTVQNFTIEDDEPSYSSMEEFGDHSNEEYHCPYCDHIIATSEKKAILFLKTGSI
jgi:hypothetical protein